MSPMERAKGSISCCGGNVIAGITGIGGRSILAHLVGQLKGVKTQQIAVCHELHDDYWRLLVIHMVISQEPSHMMSA